MAAGADVTGWKTGDAVTFDSTVYCGQCYFCRHGQINLCDHRRVLGVSCEAYRQHGAMADYVAVPQHILYRLPAGLGFERAAMVEALSVAFHSVQRTPLALDSTAVVMGTGMIGLLIVQVLRYAGCRRIIAVDLDARRLELARQLGADQVLKSDADDVIAEVMRATDQRGADAAFEVVGIRQR